MPSSHLARLSAFYEKYQPSKVSSVQATLDKYAGREEELFAALVQKYGPEPDKGSAAAAAASINPAETEERRELRLAQQALLLAVPEIERHEIVLFAEKRNVTIDSAQTVQLLLALRDSQLELERVMLGPAPVSKFSSPRALQSGGGGITARVAEGIAVLVDQEARARSRRADLEADDFSILWSRFDKNGKRLAVQQQFRIIHQGTATSVRRRVWGLWLSFVNMKHTARRKEKSSQMTPYQKLQFSKLAAKYQQQVDREEEKKRRKLDAERLAGLEERKRRLTNVRVVAAQHGDIVRRNMEQAKSPKAAQQYSASRTRNVNETWRSPSEQVQAASRSAPRETRLAGIQNEFDSLPLDLRTRLFRRLKKWELLPQQIPSSQNRRIRRHVDADISLSSDQQAAVLDRMRQEQGRADALFNSPIFGDVANMSSESVPLPEGRRLYDESSSEVESMTAEDDAALAQFLAEHLED